MAKNATDVAAGARRNGNHKPNGNGSQSAKVAGLRFDRFFTPPGSHAYDLIEWERRTAGITGEKGQVIFEQKDVEVPKSWSQLAINVVAQKYFRGSQDSPERETSVRQIIDRVVNTLAKWGREGGYFASDEDAENWAEDLRFLLVTQQASFNSPVPLRGDDSTIGYWVGSTAPSGKDVPMAEMYVPTPDYLRTMRIPLLRGRFFTEQDKLGDEPVVVIDDLLA
jgi:hypothetical protein